MPPRDVHGVLGMSMEGHSFSFSNSRTDCRWGGVQSWGGVKPPQEWGDIGGLGGGYHGTMEVVPSSGTQNCR